MILPHLMESDNEIEGGSVHKFIKNPMHSLHHEDFIFGDKNT